MPYMYACIQAADVRGTQAHKKTHDTFHGNIHWAQMTNMSQARACRKSGYIWADRDFLLLSVCFVAGLLFVSEELSRR
jgi:hypothetical protein